jgi:hypothetical protein
VIVFGINAIPFPENPIDYAEGVSYKKDVDDDTVANGLLFDDLVDSAILNEYFRQLTALLNDYETFGILTLTQAAFNAEVSEGDIRRFPESLDVLQIYKDGRWENLQREATETIPGFVDIAAILSVDNPLEKISYAMRGPNGYGKILKNFLIEVQSFSRLCRHEIFNQSMMHLI